MVLSSTNRELRDSQLVDNRWRNVWIDAQVYDSNMLSLEHAIDTTEASSEDEKDEGEKEEKEQAKKQGQKQMPKWRLRIRLRAVKGIPEPAPLLQGDLSGWGSLMAGNGISDGTRDPYVEFRLNGGTVKTSRKVLDDCNPEWQPAQVFEWEVDDPDSAEVDIVLQDWDRFWSDIVLATATMRLKPFSGVTAGVDHSLRLFSVRLFCLTFSSGFHGWTQQQRIKLNSHGFANEPGRNSTARFRQL